MKVISPITLDVKKTNIQKKIRAFTGEGGTRELVITLVSGNDTIEVPNTYVVSICGVKPDGTEFANTATVEDGKIIYTLTTQNLTVAGDVDCQVRVTKTGELLYTSKFVIKVEGNLSDEETETSSNEWTELITALDRVNALSVIFTGEGAPSTDPEEYPDIQESNFYYDETNGRYYYATNVSTTITWKRIVDKLELDTLLADKQDTLTAGDGIDITSDTVSVDLKSSGSHLDFSSGKLGVDIVTLGVSGLRQELANTSLTSSYPPLTSKTYVDNEFSKRVVKSSDLPPEQSTVDSYVEGTLWVHQAAPYHSYLLTKKTFVAPHYRYAWRDLTNLINSDNFDNALDSALQSIVKDGLDYDSETGLSVLLDNNTTNLLSFTSDNELTLLPSTIGFNSEIRDALLVANPNTKNIQEKLIAGSNITIAADGKTISAAGGSGTSYTAGNGIDITNNEISAKIVSSGNCLDFNSSGELRVLGSTIASDTSFKATMPYDNTIRQALLTTYGDYNFQPKLTAGTNITIDSNNVISASGGGSYTFTDGLTESSGTVGIDLASGSKLLIDANDKLDVDLSAKQDTIDSSHKLSADNVDDTSTTNKFVSASEKSKIADIDNKQDQTDISTDTTSTTVSLTLADNHEYRYTQDLTSLTLTMPSGDFIASIVFASGSTPTSMTYDSSIKWSGDDVTNGQFVPTEKTYNIVMWYDGINVNGVVRGVA